MARMANESGLRFSWSDPFEMFDRYADFAAMNGGHSARSYNVAYGMVTGAMIRGFDYYYEIGHGPRRLPVNNSILVFETETPLGFTAAWKFDSPRDGGPVPLAAWFARSRFGKWGYVGRGDILKKILRHCGALGNELLSVQCCGDTLMLVLSRQVNYLDHLQAASKMWDNFRSDRNAPDRDAGVCNHNG